MSEKRRLRKDVVVEVALSGRKGEWLVWHTIPGIGRGEGWAMDAQELNALTEPIPEDSEAIDVSALMKRLDPETARVLYENLWDLYDGGPPPKPIPEEEPVGLVVEVDLPVDALINFESRLFDAVGPYLPDHVSLRLTRQKPIPEEAATGKILSVRISGAIEDMIEAHTKPLLARIEALEKIERIHDSRIMDVNNRVDALEKKLEWVIKSRMHEVSERIATLEKYHFPPQTLEIVEEKDLVDWLESPTPSTAAEGPSAEEELYPGEFEVGSLIRNAVDHNGEHFFLTCSIGELAGRVCRMIRAGEGARSVRAAQADTVMTDEQMRDLVQECGLDWQSGYIRLFPGDPTNRYAVLIKAARGEADRWMIARRAASHFIPGII